MKRFSPALLMAMGVFLLTEIITHLIIYAGLDFRPELLFNSDWRIRWDSGLYLDIVTKGHTLFPCTDAPPGKLLWCGNAGWAPLYPWLIKIIHSISGLNISTIAIGLSNLFFLGFIFIMALMFEIKTLSLRNFLLLCIPAFCPGNIYYHAVFPLSQAAFFMALMLWFIKKEKYLYAGFSSMAGVLSYSIGFFLLPALACWILYNYFKKRAIFLKSFLFVFLPALFGLIIIFIYDFSCTGHWNAMFMVQDKYGYTLNSPLKILGIHIQRLFSQPFELKSWLTIQTLFIFFALLIYLGSRFIRKKTGPTTIHGLYIFFFFFLPFSASPNAGLYRNAAMLSPGFEGFNKYSNKILLILLLIFIGLSIPLGMLYMRGEMM